MSKNYFVGINNSALHKKFNNAQTARTKINEM